MKFFVSPNYNIDLELNEYATILCNLFGIPVHDNKILPSVHLEQGKNLIPLWTAEDIIYVQNWYLKKSKGKQPKYREEVSTDDNI